MSLSEKGYLKIELEDAESEIKELRDKLQAAETALTESESSNRAHVAELKIADAKIDALMLEYCQDEMTQEQRDRFAEHQVTASDARAVGESK